MSGERGSPAVRALLERAEQLASEQGAGEVTSGHLLLALAESRPGHVGQVLERHAVTGDLVRERLDADQGAPAVGKAQGPLPPAPEMAACVANAVRGAAVLGRGAFDATDLMLALLADRASIATRLLKGLGLPRERIAGDLRQLRDQDRMIKQAEAKEHGQAHGQVPCAFHVGPDACAPDECTEHLPALPGVFGELRELEARLRAVADNQRALSDRVHALIRVMRVLWVGFLLTAGLSIALALRAWRPEWFPF
ncbi:MAG: Clp protease N-terminal domain-containing protein [Planctomycetota bacterium]